MGTLQRSLAVLLSFLFASAFSPFLIFALVEGVVVVLRLNTRRIPWKALAWCLCAVAAGSAVMYLLIPVLQDDVEAGIASVSALAARGWPVYPNPLATSRYIVAYGPMAFAARIPAYWVFGETLFAFKVTGVLAFFASMFGIYRIGRHYAGKAASVIGLGCCCMVFFRFAPLPFSGRGDALILSMTVLTVWAALEAPAWAALVMAAATFAFLPNVKITAGAYLFPLVWLLVIRKGWRVAGGAVALGLVLFAVPFLSAQVTVANYWFSLNNSRHTLRLDILVRNFQYSVILLLPVITAVVYRSRNGVRLSQQQFVYLSLIICSLTVASFVGANFGSGPYHLIPCIVPILHLCFWLESEPPLNLVVWPFGYWAIAWTVSTLLFSTVNVRGFLLTLRHAGAGREAVAEIHAVEKAHPGRVVQVGVGNDFNDFRTNYGALTTLDGQPSIVGALAIRELQVAGVAIPETTIGYLERCGTEIWLIPRGETPFSAPDPYFGPDHPAFDASFRKAFLEHYGKSSSGAQYDQWSCSGTAGEGLTVGPANP